MVEVEVLARRPRRDRAARRRAPRTRPRRRPARSSRTAATSSTDVEVGHPQDDALERAALARALGVEQRQLAELRVDSDEREACPSPRSRACRGGRRGTWPAARDRRPRGPRGPGWWGRRSGSSRAFTPRRRFQSRPPRRATAGSSWPPRSPRGARPRTCPGIGSITGERASSHASAICAGVASCCLRDPVERPARLGEPAGREREPRDESDARALARLEHVLRVAVGEVVAVLHRHDLDDPARLRRAPSSEHVRDADVPDLALVLQLLERADRVLVRHLQGRASAAGRGRCGRASAGAGSPRSTPSAAPAARRAATGPGPCGAGRPSWRSRDRPDRDGAPRRSGSR